MHAITVENLTRRFDDVVAVDHVSFSVGMGELFGFLGPNGAGKSTTINMLSTLLRPTSGRASVAGFDVVSRRDDVRRNIGIVFQEPALDGRLTGRENLEFHAILYGLDRAVRVSRIAEVFSLVELGDKADLLVEKYSGGMKRRLEIARGLIHMPKVLFLDEPTLGLDTQTRRHIWDYIRKLNRDNGVTIILTTHYMEEADYLCDRIAIIDYGKIVVLDEPSTLKDRLGGDIICLEVEAGRDALAGKLRTLPWVRSAKCHGRHLDLTVEQGEKHIPDLVTLAAEAGVTVDSVQLHKPSLEDVFLHYTGKTIREEESEGAGRGVPERVRT